MEVHGLSRMLMTTRLPQVSYADGFMKNVVDKQWVALADRKSALDKVVPCHKDAVNVVLTDVRHENIKSFLEKEKEPVKKASVTKQVAVSSPLW